MSAPPELPDLPRAGLDALRALVDRLGRTPASPGALPSARVPAPLKAVAAHQATWTRLRADRRLREALAQVPAQAGPLNSPHLVHRALQELHTLAPAYLDALLRHVDTLLWLEQSGGLGELAPRPGPGRRRG